MAEAFWRRSAGGWADGGYQPASLHRRRRGARGVPRKPDGRADRSVAAVIHGTAGQSAGRFAPRPPLLLAVCHGPAESGVYAAAGARGNDVAPSAGSQAISAGTQGAQPGRGLSAVARAVFRECAVLSASADVDGDCGGGAAAGVCERRQPDAGAVLRAAQGTGDSHVIGCDALETGAAALVREPAAGVCRWGSCHADHVLDGGIDDEVYAADGLSLPAGYPGRPCGLAGDGGDLGVDGRDFWDPAGAASLECGAHHGVEGGGWKLVGKI